MTPQNLRGFSDGKLCIVIVGCKNVSGALIVGGTSVSGALIVGGTSVTGALECPSSEKRMIISLDTSQMVSQSLCPSIRSIISSIDLIVE